MMIKFLIFALLFITTLTASKIEIEAGFFEVDESKGITTVSGNVIVKRDLDVMKADEMLIYTDEKRKIVKLIATGKSTFEIHLDENVTFTGSADSFTYNTKKQEFKLMGNAKLEDQTNHRLLMGETVILNEVAKKATVVGGEKRPVKLIFSTE
jgi:lipopolysaccharide export system protein LptA